MRSGVGVFGMSAGGGLAAALTLLVRDRGGPRICFQVLDAPQLDDRLATPSMPACVDTPVLNRQDAEISWTLYLSGRVADLSGMPPAYISLYEHDPLRDEGLAYAAGLLRTGVAVELHVFPAPFHRSTVIDAEVSRRQVAETIDALGRGLRALAINVDSDADVIAVLAAAEAAGARITKPAIRSPFFDGLDGYFFDPDGHAWEVAHNPDLTG